MVLSKQGEEGNTTLLTDMKGEEVKVALFKGFPRVANYNNLIR